MTPRCLCCLVEKDLAKLEVYPYPEDDCLCEDPMEKLLCIDAQPESGHGYRMAIFCHECWHRLVVTRGIDMWIGQQCWESLNPKTPFCELPMLIKNQTIPTPSGELKNCTDWNPSSYFNPEIDPMAASLQHPTAVPSTHERLDDQSDAPATTLRPLADRAIILPDPKIKESSGGILLPDGAQERPCRGTVIRVGPGCFKDGVFLEPPVQPNDRVLYERYQGKDVDDDGRDVRVLKFEDIIAVIEV